VVLFLFPIFNSRVFPVLAKAGFALVLSLAVLPVVHLDPDLFPENSIALVILMASELMIGLILGLTVRMFFASVQLAGQLISFQMGFGLINVLDPQTGTQVSILDQIGYFMVLLIFFLLNGHHILISAMIQSFQIVDIGLIVLTKGIFVRIMSLASDMFVLAVQIGSPAIVSLLFVSAAFGLSAKFSPQMNILIAAFPVKICVGLLFFCVTLQLISVATHAYLGRFKPIITSLLVSLGSG